MPGMVQVERGSNVVKGNMASSLEGGDRIRIGHEFETEVVVDDDMEVDGADDSTFKIKDGWKLDSACKYAWGGGWTGWRGWRGCWGRRGAGWSGRAGGAGGTCG